MSDTTTGYRPASAEPLDPALEELLRAQVEDWTRGTPHPLKSYLDRQPALRGRPSVVVELINQEVVLRQMRGEMPRPEDYLADYPELSDSLIRLFEVHAAASLLTEVREAEPAVTPSAEGSGVPRESGARLPRIPGYQVERVLGRGGMGIVYLARHDALNRHVALKLLKDPGDDDPAHLARFRREAAAAARCQHPNLVQIHDFDEYDGEFYLALEYVAGGHLGRALAGEPQPPRRAAELVETLARAIDHTHAQGVVHRDLKPANVLLTPDGQPKVTDFGLAKLADSSAQTEVGTLVGTLAYMAPEQVRAGSGEIGPRTDIHALGTILYEALTGRPPYRAETSQRILHAILSEEVVPPSTRQPGIPRDLEAICLKCLEKEPDRRYATAADLAEDLRRFLDSRPTAARRASAAERCIRWCRRNPWIAASVALLFLGTTTSIWQAIRATRERDRAESQAAISKAVREFLEKDLLEQASGGYQTLLGEKLEPELTVRMALDRASRKIGDRFADRPLVEAEIRRAIGGAYANLGLYHQARPHFERALDLFRTILGPEAPETFIAMLDVGSLLQQDAKIAEAQRYLVPAMEGLRKTKGEDDPETLMAMIYVGDLDLSLGKVEEAARLLSRAVEGVGRVRAGEDIATLRALRGLAIVSLAQTNPADAERMGEEAVRRLQEEFGADDHFTLTAMRNLAGAYTNSGKKEKAEHLLREVLEGQRHILGDKHPVTLYTMVLLAAHYLQERKMDEVEKYAAEALEGARGALDDKHETRQAALACLSSVYSSRGDMKKLEPMLVESVEITRSRWGAYNGLTAGGNGALGLLFIKKAEYSRAEQPFGEVLAYWNKVNPDDPKRFWAELHLGIVLLAQKKYDEARPRLIAAYNGLKPPEKSDFPANTSDLFRIIEPILQLRDASGQPSNDACLKKLRDDPALQAIVFDLQFPDDPFAQP